MPCRRRIIIITAALIKIKQFLSLHRNKLIAVAVIFFAEYLLAFQFYSREPEFPTEIFTIDVANRFLRDMLLACILMLLRKHWIAVKEFAKDYCPIVIVCLLWLGISLTMINSLRLILNPTTLLSVLAGVLNNVIFVVLAAYLYTKWNHLLSKALYFLSYLLTLFVFYSDTLYFFVTSTHIKKVLFANLNSYSIAGVISTTDKGVLLGIALSFIFLLLLFRTPKQPHFLPGKNIGALVLTVCVLANLVNIATAYTYPKLLLENGYNEESELEKSRNVSRDLLSESVTLNLVQEIWQNDEQYVPVSSHLRHYPFTKEETYLLDELGMNLQDKPVPVPNFSPYEKIVVIIAESFHRDYMHYYNPLIPREATPFLDSLVAKYPHSDHYYTANAPTTQGLNSTFISQALYSEEQAFENNPTIFRALEKHGYKTMFLEATSQYYNDEFRAYKKRFGMNVYRAKEDLEKEGYTGSSGWGFHNDVMYEETLKILEKNRNGKLFLVTKTIDSHQPYPYCGFLDETLPTAIKDAPKNQYLKAIYWENMTLQTFFQELEKRNLLDDKTLIIFTSDHNPHPSQNSNYKRLGEGELSVNPAPIPLIFVSKHLQPFSNFSSTTYGSQIDFAPTLLGLLGFPSPPEFSGKNMLTIAPDRSYAIGSLGETIYYWSENQQIETDMYTGKNPNAYEKALVHWVEDAYVKYVLDGSARNGQ